MKESLDTIFDCETDALEELETNDGEKLFWAFEITDCFDDVPEYIKDYEGY